MPGWMRNKSPQARAGGSVPRWNPLAHAQGLDGDGAILTDVPMRAESRSAARPSTTAASMKPWEPTSVTAVPAAAWKSTGAAVWGQYKAVEFDSLLAAVGWHLGGGAC